jgi:hypothetical protein
MRASLFVEQFFVAVRLSIIHDSLLDTLLRCCQAKKLKRPVTFVLIRAAPENEKPERSGPSMVPPLIFDYRI